MRWIGAALLVAAAAAQERGVRVTGVVKDVSAQAIGNAEVQLIGPGVRPYRITGPASIAIRRST